MADNKKTPLIVVVGATASGKTALGVRIAKAVDGEVVSADSMQIYKGMEIATASPTAEEREGVPHHLIGYVSPFEEYSVVRYIGDAKTAIADIDSRGKRAVLVGGTGLYINSLIDNISFEKEEKNDALRQELNDIAAKDGGETLLSRLAEFDPEYAASLHPNNCKRIIRAIEIYMNTGKTMTEHLKESRLQASDYDLCMIGIRFANRQNLYDRINRRVDIMVENGLVDEAKRAYSEYGSTATQAIGHKELWYYINGEQSLDEAIEVLKRKTRNYAKRQITWFSRDGRINWIDADNRSLDEIFYDARKIMEKYGIT